ncbi:MAG TPA: hypothetical protein VKD26_01195 [Streptosporangiaceae bacterium]|nr:hypothetical protein [Streptosporangiaceae bacterium]
MRWEDVDFAAGVIRVRKAPHTRKDPATGKKVLFLADLKTQRSRRTLAMPAAVAEASRALKVAQALVRVGAIGCRVDIEDLADACGHINSNVTRTVHRHVIADKLTKTSASWIRFSAPGAARERHRLPGLAPAGGQRRYRRRSAGASVMARYYCPRELTGRIVAARTGPPVNDHYPERLR